MNTDSYEYKVLQEIASTEKSNILEKLKYAKKKVGNW